MKTKRNTQKLTARERISRTIIRLMRDKEGGIVYAALLLAHNLVEDDSIKTACIDGVTMKYSPTFVDSLTDDALECVLDHEALHVLLGHHLRAEPMKMLAAFESGAEGVAEMWRQWQQATDCAANSLLKHKRGFPTEIALLAETLDMESGKPAEHYLSELKKRADAAKPPEPEDGDGEPDESEPEEDDQSDESESDSDQDTSGAGDDSDDAQSDSGDESGTQSECPECGDDHQHGECFTGDADADADDAEQQEGESGSSSGSGGSDEDGESESGAASAGSSQSDENESQDPQDTSHADEGSDAADAGTEPAATPDALPDSDSMGDVMPHPDATGDEADDAALVQQWQTRVAEAAMQAKGCGSLPAWIEEMVERMLTPAQINWKQKLRRFARKFARTGMSYQRPNKLHIWRHDAVILPARGELSVDRGVFIVDTSGSMSIPECELVLNELQGVLRSFPKSKLTVIQCDTRVTAEHEFSAREKFNVGTWSVKGRGGTNMTPAFERAEELKPNFIVCLTDGEMNFPTESKTKTLWLMTRGSIVAPWGETARVDMNEEK